MKLVDPTPHELKATEHGGAMGGEYLDSINKTDLAMLTKEEWNTFLLCVVGGYTEKLAELNTISQ